MLKARSAQSNSSLSSKCKKPYLDVYKVTNMWPQQIINKTTSFSFLYDCVCNKV